MLFFRLQLKFLYNIEIYHGSNKDMVMQYTQWWFTKYTHPHCNHLDNCQLRDSFHLRGDTVTSPTTWWNAGINSLEEAFKDDRHLQLKYLISQTISLKCTCETLVGKCQQLQTRSQAHWWWYPLHYGILLIFFPHFVSLFRFSYIMPHIRQCYLDNQWWIWLYFLYMFRWWLNTNILFYILSYSSGSSRQWGQMRGGLHHLTLLLQLLVWSWLWWGWVHLDHPWYRFE